MAKPQISLGKTGVPGFTAVLNRGCFVPCMCRQDLSLPVMTGRAPS